MRNVARSRLIWGTALIAVVTTAVAVTFLVTQFGYNQVLLKKLVQTGSQIFCALSDSWIGQIIMILTQMIFLKGDVLITTTTQMILTTITTTIIPTTTRPIPTFTPIPITSGPTTKTTSMSMMTSSVAKTTQMTSSRTIQSTEKFLKGSKILILNSRNFHKSMTINEKNHFQNANITFELGTQAYKACSAWFLLFFPPTHQAIFDHLSLAHAKWKPIKVTFKNEFYIFGGRTEDRQVSKLESCSVKKLFDLPFDFQFGACGTYSDYEAGFKKVFRSKTVSNIPVCIFFQPRKDFVLLCFGKSPWNACQR